MSDPTYVVDLDISRASFASEWQQFFVQKRNAGDVSRLESLATRAGREWADAHDRFIEEIQQKTLPARVHPLSKYGAVHNSPGSATVNDAAVTAAVAAVAAQGGGMIMIDGLYYLSGGVEYADRITFQGVHRLLTGFIYGGVGSALRPPAAAQSDGGTRVLDVAFKNFRVETTDASGIGIDATNVSNSVFEDIDARGLGIGIRQRFLSERNSAYRCKANGTGTLFAIEAGTRGFNARDCYTAGGRFATIEIDTAGGLSTPSINDILFSGCRAEGLTANNPAFEITHDGSIASTIEFIRWEHCRFTAPSATPTDRVGIQVNESGGGLVERCVYVHDMNDALPTDNIIRISVAAVEQTGVAKSTALLSRHWYIVRRSYHALGIRHASRDNPIADTNASLLTYPDQNDQFSIRSQPDSTYADLNGRFIRSQAYPGRLEGPVIRVEGATAHTIGANWTLNGNWGSGAAAVVGSQASNDGRGAIEITVGTAPGGGDLVITMTPSSNYPTSGGAEMFTKVEPRPSGSDDLYWEQTGSANNEIEFTLRGTTPTVGQVIGLKYFAVVL